jgi:hypothetical protein
VVPLCIGIELPELLIQALGLQQQLILFNYLK